MAQATSTIEDYARERKRLIRFLARGGAVVREDRGGVVGIDCTSASRNGRRFDGDVLDRLRETGCVIRGQPRALVRDQGRALETYRFDLAAPLAPEP